MITTQSNVLRAPWLQLARAAWVTICVLSVVLFGIGLNNQLHTPLPDCQVHEADCNAGTLGLADAALARQAGLPVSLTTVEVAGILIARLALLLIAVLIFWRRSNDWVALSLSSLLLTVLVENGFPGLGSWDWFIKGLQIIGSLLFYLFFFVFPSGRVEPRWLGWVALPPVVVISITTGLSLYQGLWAWVNAGLTILVTGLAIYAMLYRYRRVSTLVERQQTKWAWAGLAGLLLVGVCWIGAGLFFPANQPSLERLVALLLIMCVYVGCYSFFAFAIGVAVFRHRLWDIDILIRRTLVYSVLTALLALVYLLSVVILQALLAGVTGEQSPVAVVISTLTIAALFFPLRSRVQDFIDRRFFRKKYDAAKTLEAFATLARDETDLAELTQRLSEVVEETMQPESVGIWLRNLEARDARHL